MISVLYPKETFIDDHNYLQHVNETVNLSKGREARSYSANPFGSLRAAKPLPESLRIPKSKWLDLVKYKEATQTRLSDFIRFEIQNSRLRSKNQQNTNYCWCNAVVGAMEVSRAVSGFPYLDLSPASVAAQIKGYRNQGGWGGEALDFIVDHGIAKSSEWPANYWQNSKYLTQDLKQKMLTRRIFGFYDIQNRDFEGAASLVLQNIPVPIGLNWWGHEVYAVDLVAIDNVTFGFRFRNSWGDDYGDQGFNVLSYAHSIPDDALGVTAVNSGEI
jgi:hypothetical protein